MKLRTINEAIDSSPNQQFLTYFKENFSGDDQLAEQVDMDGFTSEGAAERCDLMIEEWQKQFCEEQKLNFEEFKEQWDNSDEEYELLDYIEGYYGEEEEEDLNEAYTAQNMSISKNELRFESLGADEQAILADVFGDAWDGDDLTIDFKKVAAMRKRVG